MNETNVPEGTAILITTNHDIAIPTVTIIVDGPFNETWGNILRPALMWHGQKILEGVLSNYSPADNAEAKDEFLGYA